jgi:feruloyl esterase
MPYWQPSRPKKRESKGAQEAVRMFRRVVGLSPLAVSGILLMTFAAKAAWAQQPCEKLTELKLTRAAITSAKVVAAGPIPGRSGRPPIEAPERCVVEGVARPTKDSEISFEVWLPVNGWNDKYQQVGNGGWAGSIPTGSLVNAIQRGYATAGTDDGHRSSGAGDASWAIGHPEKLIDFGWRAVHQTSVQAKAVIRAFYGKDAAYNYFVGCSDGGREALSEAQRFPEDFHGIIAAAPAYDWSHHFTGFIWNEQAMTHEPGSAIPAAKLAAIQKAAVGACDSLDGVTDGLLEDPRLCRFDPAVITCKGADGPDCLTAPQVTALQKIYAGPKNPRTGKQIYPGYSPGTEGAPGSWAGWIMNSPDIAIQFAFGNSYYGHAVFEDPKWDYRTLDFDSDIEFGDRKAGVIINSNNPDLRSFRANGGKLITYHGWGDAAIAPLSSIEYYEKVTAFLKKFPDARSDSSRPVQDFYRLFMVPGLGHCNGGIGANHFGNDSYAVEGMRGNPERDVLAALERWVEKGVAPDRIIATGASPADPSKTLTRPLCPYPTVARYNGAGDPNDAASFSCAAPAAER